MRYAFLRDAAKERLILTAHHADDNAETMLLNLLRGTGLRGLTGIPASPPGIRRPFLEIPQAELAAYAAGVQEFHIPYDVLTEHLDESAKLTLGLTSE